MKFAINITASKLMSFCILAGALVLDIKSGGSTAFMFAVPFVSALVLGKQYFDKGRNEQA
jgi:hypothetical protein